VEQAASPEHGHTVTHTKPSVNARLRAWFGRRFGTRYLLPMLLREEGEGGQGIPQPPPGIEPP